MKKWIAPYLIISLSISGCGGQSCEPIFVPVYDVMIYDAMNGELLCREQPGLFPEGDCQVDFVYSDDGFSATITVMLEGYADHIQADVENETWRLGCFNQPSYTTEVSIFLTSNG